MSEVEVTPLLKPRRNVVLVETAEQLYAAIDDLRAHQGPFAIDAERASGFKYSQRAYLIQVSRRNSQLFLIDPAALAPEVTSRPFEDLAELLASDTWILHAATQDLPCLAEIGLRPTTIFDTELGSRLNGLERVGLGAVVEHYLHLQLAKEHSAVDWSKRPLEASWLDYAALDVDVMHEVMDGVQRDLAANGKAEWAAEEFTALVGFTPKPPKADKWRTTTGLHEVKDQRGLAVAKALWEARETLGRKLDISPGRLIPDVSISHVAKTLPKTRPILANDKGFHGRASRNYLDTWWDAIAFGLETHDLPPLRTAATGIPNHRNWPNKFPKAAARLAAARTLLAELAEVNQLPVENLISPEPVRQAMWIERSDVDEGQLKAELLSYGVRNWQIELVTDSLVKAIQSDEQQAHQEPEHKEL
ncbi:MAG: HRDC domain-containing protein [Micrococcales bacterium]